MAALKEQLEGFKNRLDKVLHEKNKLTDVLEKIEQKTGVRRLYIALGFCAFIAVYLMVGYGAQFLCNFIGFIYPAYASVKAIESHDKEDDTKWLTYWVVYSVFHLVEFFSDIFLFWIPFYWLLKCIFLVWCFLPVPWNGSHMLYYRFIRPFILRHQDRIDTALDKAKDAVSEVLEHLRGLEWAMWPLISVLVFCSRGFHLLGMEFFTVLLVFNLAKKSSDESSGGTLTGQLKNFTQNAKDMAGELAQDEAVRRVVDSAKLD